jgi:hypothetical protein
MTDVEQQQQPQYPEDYEPITVEERAKWEATQDLSGFVKVRNSAADTFTPYQIKFLTKGGRKYMGCYGILALTLLLVLTLMNLYALRNESIIVIVNSLLAFVVSLLTLEKMISGLLNSFIKKFQ